jgi:beta-phosphoglucomutase
MGFHALAFVAFAERHRLPPFTEADRGRFDGRRNRDIFPDLFGRALSEQELRLYAEEKEALYRELSKGRLAPVAGFLALLEALERRRIPVALATSAPAQNVAYTLGELGLAERLTRVVRSDQVTRGKPHPDVFLGAAALIGVPPDACVAFEDAPLGVLAARAAGMAVVGLTTTFSRDRFAAHAALPDHAVRDFAEYLCGPGAWLTARRPAAASCSWRSRS